MTKAEAKEFGTEYGRMRAEGVCLEPPFDALPKILTKWRSADQWSKAAHDDERWLRGKKPMTDDEWKTAKAAYIAAGLKFVKDYIKELKSDGLLREMR